MSRRQDKKTKDGMEATNKKRKFDKDETGKSDETRLKGALIFDEENEKVEQIVETTQIEEAEIIGENEKIKAEKVKIEEKQNETVVLKEERKEEMQNEKVPTKFDRNGVVVKQKKRENNPAEIAKAEENKKSLEKKNKGRGRVCPYLGTVNRSLLDFDFEKLCSCSLTNLHVYACLVCGLYFQGIGKSTHAYKHALEKNHYVFINLETCKTYCVPENYEIEDASLNDIKYFLKPSYTKQQVENFCKTPMLGKSLDGADFIPGCVGLNNLKNTDYCNVIIQLLCAVVPLRNVLLLVESKTHNAKNLIIILSELVKKMYNPQNFKGVVSPHEFLQTVGIESNKNFKIGTGKDPYDFFCWLINKIYRYSKRKIRKKRKMAPNEANDVRKRSNKKKKKGEQKVEQIKWSYEDENIIDYCFDGVLLVKTKKEKNNIIDEANEREIKNFTVKNRTKQMQAKEKEKRKEEENEEEEEEEKEEEEEEEENEDGTVFKIKKTPFRTLSLTLPNVPIFKNVTESNIIPQVSIFELLAKFDGETESILANEKNPCVLSISKLPKYLIFTIKRFSKNNFFVEKNGTIVNFVMKNLDMKEYIHPKYIEQNPVTKYNLIANIFHSGTVNQGIYKIHVLNQSSNEWYEIEDLHVTSVLPQLILLSESCMQLYQRQDVQYNGDLASFL